MLLMYNSYTVFIFILIDCCYKATIMLIVFTEMILSFFDFHLLSDPPVEDILQQQMCVSHKKHPV